MERSFIRRPPQVEIRDRFRGCLLGGAVGDALGAPVEFASRRSILDRFGESGVRDMLPAYGRIGAITDDTQMTLFTAEGVLRSFVRASLRGICNPRDVIARAYLRWLHTQGISHPLEQRVLNGWLIENRELFARRAPGLTCLWALETLEYPGDPAQNDSKGCGGVMRVAPIGMMFRSLQPAAFGRGSGDASRSFTLACEAASITHGHPTGQLAAGVFAATIFGALGGAELEEALEIALALLGEDADRDETLVACRTALQLAKDEPNSPDALRSLGEGLVAEEALAIGLYCALSARSYEEGVVLAVNHDGDSNSTGLITGHLLGAIQGIDAIPKRWLEPLELRTVLEEVADDLATVGDWRLNDAEAREEEEYYTSRYPGG